ncbi:MAG: hypothetical protein JWP61_1701, partial [Friedmanniella sp.]|nr:hypothetical protein [Friedmanniella sp.]
GGLTGALNLAAAGQISVADAAETGATALSVFNLQGDQMSHVADLLAAGAGKAQGSVGDMSAALNQSALVAAQMGLSIEDTSGALAMFAHNGLIGSDAGTSFKSMLQRLNPQSKEAATLMDDLGLRAYDAQGNFVGLAGYADQLKGALSTMSEETRNATLTTLFGSDAIRAAAILYKEGAKGVDEWTGKVNDAGFAARQAAALNDNLRGDLEKLGGAFDSLMTSMGTGTQGALRDLVQMLTGLVQVGGDVLGFFTSLPGPVLAAVGAALGWAVAGERIMGILRPMGGVMGPLKGAWSAFGEALGYARTNGDGLGTVLKSVGSYAGGQTLSAMKGLAKAIGPELGIAAATYAVIKFTDVLLHAGYTTVDVAGYQDQLAAALRSTNGAIDDSVRALAAQKAADQELSGDTNLLRVAKAAGVELPHLTDALLGNKGAYDEVTGSLLRYQKAHTLERGDAQGNLVYTLDGEGKSAEDARNALDKLLPTLAGAVEDNRLVAEASGQAGAGLDKAGAAATGAANGMASVASSAESTFGSLEGYAAALGLDKDATQELIDKSNALGESLADFVNPLGAYTGLLDEKKEADRKAAEATAAGTKSSADSWEDYVTNVTVSFEEYKTRLEEQVTAQENWQTNMLLLAGRVSQGTLDELARMGPEGAPLVADLVKRSDAELDHMDDLFAKRSQEATDAWGAKLTEAAPVLAAIGRVAGQGVVDSLAAKLQAGTATVAGIAAKYGVVLSDGINPVLVALGHRPIAGMNGHLGGLTEHWSGGYTGDGGKHEPKGIVHGGEFVFTKEQTSRAGVNQLSTLAGMLSGYSGGGFVSAASVPRPPSTAPYRPPISTAGDAVMGREYDEITAWLTANQEPMGYGGGTATASSSALVKFGMWLQKQGATVSEHPAFGGVTMGAHVPGSKHYSGRAIDVNTRPGTSALEQHELAPLMAAAVAAGFRTIFMSAGHFNHGHVESYKTGIASVPKDGLAYLHQGERVVPKEQNVAAAMPGYGQPAEPVFNIQFLVDGQEFRGMATVVVNGRLEDLHRKKTYR